MSLDGAMLAVIRQDILKIVDNNARVEKVHIPSKNQMVIAMRWQGGHGKLFISASADNPRIHFTDRAVDNPKTPPMFCMLLRKHMTGAKLIDVRQPSMDRILFLEFEARNEFGDLTKLTLSVEIMGRHSNIILINENGRVVDSIKRVGLEMSSVRQVLPGIEYSIPPSQDKLVLGESSPSEIIHRIKSGKDMELSKAIQRNIMGFSPVLAREIGFMSTGGMSLNVSEMNDDNWGALGKSIDKLYTDISNGTISPTVVFDSGKKPCEFSFIPITHYPKDKYSTKKFDTIGNMLDFYFGERDRLERMRSRSSDLLTLLSTISDRISRRLAVQSEELQQCKNREELKIKGDLISANMYNIKKGDTCAVVENFYDELFPEVKIDLDPRLTPVQNSQKYYAEYRKADTAEKHLKSLIEDGEREFLYIESVYDAVNRTSNEDELMEIRRELYEAKYIKSVGSKKNVIKKMPPMMYISSDGFTILVGRNNHGNDQLTLKSSSKSDIWFHTQKIPGSHTVIKTDGREVPDRTLEEAAVIAAYHSRARESSGVPVDYTFIRNVKKPSGARPGLVIYENYKTVFVNPDEERVRMLEK